MLFYLTVEDLVSNRTAQAGCLLAVGIASFFWFCVIIGMWLLLAALVHPVS